MRNYFIIIVLSFFIWVCFLTRFLNFTVGIGFCIVSDLFRFKTSTDWLSLLFDQCPSSPYRCIHELKIFLNFKILVTIASLLCNDLILPVDPECFCFSLILIWALVCLFIIESIIPLVTHLVSKLIFGFLNFMLSISISLGLLALIWIIWTLAYYSLK